MQPDTPTFTHSFSCPIEVYGQEKIGLLLLTGRADFKAGAWSCSSISPYVNPALLVMLGLLYHWS